MRKTVLLQLGIFRAFTFCLMTVATGPVLLSQATTPPPPLTATVSTPGTTIQIKGSEGVQVLVYWKAPEGEHGPTDCNASTLESFQPVPIIGSDPKTHLFALNGAETLTVSLSKTLAAGDYLCVYGRLKSGEISTSTLLKVPDSPKLRFVRKPGVGDQSVTISNSRGATIWLYDLGTAADLGGRTCDASGTMGIMPIDLANGSGSSEHIDVGSGNDTAVTLSEKLKDDMNLCIKAKSKEGHFSYSDIQAIPPKPPAPAAFASAKDGQLTPGKKFTITGPKG